MGVFQLTAFTCSHGRDRNDRLAFTATASTVNHINPTYTWNIPPTRPIPTPRLIALHCIGFSLFLHPSQLAT
jgi:hypothetical protein